MIFNFKITDIETAEKILGKQPWIYPYTRAVSLVDDTDTMREEWVSRNNKHVVVYVDDISQPRLYYSLPTIDHVKEALSHLTNLTDSDKILIHCHAGVSRSTAIAIAALVQNGVDPAEAIDQIEEIRPCLWPNQLIIKHADDYLGLKGKLYNEVLDWKQSRRGYYDIAYQG